VPLPPKTFDLLLLLVENRERIMLKADLMGALWPDTLVEEANLSFQISALRKALGDDGSRYIETSPKRGYRFCSPVAEIAPEPDAGPDRENSARLPTRTFFSSPLRLRYLAVGAALLFVVGLYTFRKMQSETQAKSEPTAMTPLTAYPGIQKQPSLSPDGSQVAFAWDGMNHDNFDIYVKLVGPGEPVRITTNAARDEQPAWSPDGKLIAFVRFAAPGTSLDRTSSVFVLPALGGAERKLTDRFRPAWPYPQKEDLSWTPDGKWIAFPAGSPQDELAGLRMVSVATGETRQLTNAGVKFQGDHSPSFSPDGRFLAFIREPGPSASQVYLLPLTSNFTPSGKEVRVTSGNRNIVGVAWTPDSNAVVFSAGSHTGAMSLHRITVAPLAAEAARKPELLPFGEDSAALSISRSGRLVYAKYSNETHLWNLPLTTSHRASSSPVPVAPSNSLNSAPDYSPDGTRIAFASTRSGSDEIWVSKTDGSDLMQVTSVRGRKTANPRWSPDGKTILFNSWSAGSSDLYLVEPGGGELRRLTDDPSDESEARWSRDGSWIYLTSGKTGRPELYKMRMSGGAYVQVTSNGGRAGCESPDGKWIYYTKGFDSPASIWKIPSSGGEESKLIDDLILALNFTVLEKGLYYMAGGIRPGNNSIKYFDFATGKTTEVAHLEKRPYFGMAISPDQRSLLFPLVERTRSNLMYVENFH
jgi:Tol biopolymer transport system component/DNA-binding winged helix-turn-helix (wHTH) protein